jgi:SpoIID/LytB domain protein
VLDRFSRARRVTLAVTAGAIVATSVILPVADLRLGGSDDQARMEASEASKALAQRAPVTPTLSVIALAGVDEQALADSAVSMASWDQLTGDAHVEELGLAALPEGWDSDGHALHVAPALSTPLKPAIATPQTSTGDFGLVGVTTQTPMDDSSRVLVRVRQGGVWGEWTPLPVSDHAPDPDSLEAQGVRFGTEPLITGDADGVQVRIDTPGGAAPKDAQVMLMDNPVVTEDGDLPSGPVVSDLPISTAAAATIGSPMPTIITRAQWGADESMRRAGPKYSGTIKAAFLHHTVTSNTYSPEQAAQQVRNLYSWYVKGLRYSDMAYNFLVDRFGRLYEGRAGGMDQAVIGGHTAGFNQDTFAVSAVGNFQSQNPPADQMAAIDESVAQLMAWKLSLNHRDPNGTSVLVSDSGAGTSRYNAGQQANALVIGGHRDIGQTACPGKFLEPELPKIRAMVASKMGVTAFNPAVSGPVAWGAPDPLVLNATTTAPIAWTVTIASRCGTAVRTLTGQQDAVGALAIGWDKLDGAGQQVPPGTYSFTLSGASNGDAIYPWTGTGVIASAPGSPLDPCGPPTQFAISGSGFGHGVGLSQWGAYGMAKEGSDAATIVTHYYTGTTVSPIQDDMDARINLLYQVPTAQMRTETLESGGGAMEVTVGATVTPGGPGDVFAFVVNGASVGVQKITGGTPTDLGAAATVTVRWAGTRAPGTAAGAATLLNVIGPNGSFGSAGHRYRYGSVDVTAVNSSGGVKLNVVNSVRVHDEYLYGISEVSNSWPNAAMQAQVIAARSYALSKISDGLRKACSCNMDDGDGPYSDQTFIGWGKQSGAKGELWTAAVNATLASDTTGLAALYNGVPIKAFYTASTGGATTSVKDVWGGDLPYAVSVDDHWSLNAENSNRVWNVVASQASAAKAFGVPGVWKLDVTERFSSGAAKTVTATLQDGSQKSIGASAFRSAFGLKSTYVTAIDGSTGAGNGAPATAAPASPVAVASTITMKIGPMKPRVGSSVRFTGLVKPQAKGLVVERQMLVNGAWVLKAKTKTKKGGAYTFTIKKAVPEGARYSYRVVVYRAGVIVGTSAEKIVVIRGKKG